MGAVRALCRAYRAMLVARNPDLPEIVDQYYEAAAYEALLDRLPEVHARPDGAIFVSERDGTVLACGMTQRLDGETVEIKRVFVDEAARGAGLGRALCVAAMDRARAGGYRRIALDTMVTLPEAIALYEGLGFRPCPPYHKLPPNLAPRVLFLGADL